MGGNDFWYSHSHGLIPIPIPSHSEFCTSVPSPPNSNSVITTLSYSHSHSRCPAALCTMNTGYMESPTKSCALDPIPTFLLKEQVDVLLPFVTAMINASLCVRDDYRHRRSMRSSLRSSRRPAWTRMS